MAYLTTTAAPGSLEIVTVFEFDAPRELVYRVMTDPALIGEWWGPADLVTTVEKMDVRPGGMWRVVQRDPAGNEYAFHGVYHTLSFPGRIAYTFEWEALPDHVLLETLTLEEVGGKTRVTDQQVFQSVSDRDGMLATGMESGSVETGRRLGELIARAAAQG